MAPDPMDAEARAIALFREEFGGEPEAVVRAPGRVNLIGEHTDYNDGFVLPAAIDRDLCLAIRRRSDRVVDARSEGLENATVVLDRFDRKVGGWGAYVQGVAWALTESGRSLVGWDGAIGSDVPVGAGLSSSAAIEVATARAFEVATGFGWDPTEMATLCRRAENDWVGLASGIMDQLTSARGRAGHALLLDCRSLEVDPVPIPRGIGIVVLDTGTRRELQASGYNDRRRECEEAARALGVATLRDVTLAELEARAADVPPILLRRARHVVTENARTNAAASSMRSGGVDALGRLLFESHASMRDDFELSSDALDAMVEAARAAPGCVGARLTGGGFGGCAVALVELDAMAGFERSVADSYTTATGRTGEVIPCRASDGASARTL